MRGVWLLSFRHLAHHRVRSAILVLCIGVAVFLPVTVHVLTDRYHEDLQARARTTPLVAGAVGNRFDLTLAALYFRQAELETMPYSELTALRATGHATIIPIHARFTARRLPIVGTTPEYYDLRQLQPARGTLPLRLGDAVLGAGVAEALQLGPGDALFSDPADVYDLARPPALKMRIAGVLPHTGSADDDAVFVDVKTCWILEGIAHGHDDAENVDESLILGEAESVVQVSPALRSYQEVTDDNVDSFHYHGDESLLPLTAVIADPHDDKASTLLKTRVNTERLWQMVEPTAVIDDLMQVVFRIRVLFDAFAVVLGFTTTLLLGGQILLSMRLRAREMTTLHRMGCSRHMVAALYATEIALILGAGLLLGILLSGIAVASVPDLLR